MTVREALASAAARLGDVGDTPRLDGELLMAHALGLEREAMLLGALEVPAPAAFEPLLARRMACEPVAYITGRRDFWTLRLSVTPAVLIPRPDSETLIEAAIEAFGGRAPRRILDLGTGSGALLLAALDRWPDATGLGVDLSPAAIALAGENGVRLGMGDRAQFRPGDWGAGLGERFDLILCNPPYVEAGAALPPDVRLYEPPLALFAGPDGLAAYRILARQLPGLLEPGGVAALEIGAGQAAAVSGLFAAESLTATPRHDLAGRIRCLVITA